MGPLRKRTSDGEGWGVAGLGCRILALPQQLCHMRCGLHSQQTRKRTSVKWPVALMRSRVKSGPTKGAETSGSGAGTSMATLQEHLRGLGQAASVLGGQGKPALPLSATISFRPGIWPKPAEATCKRSFSPYPQGNVGSEAADMSVGQLAAGQPTISQLLIAKHRMPGTTSSYLALVLLSCFA